MLINVLRNPSLRTPIGTEPKPLTPEERQTLIDQHRAEIEAARAGAPPPVQPNEPKSYAFSRMMHKKADALEATADLPYNERESVFRKVNSDLAVEQENIRNAGLRAFGYDGKGVNASMRAAELKKQQWVDWLSKSHELIDDAVYQGNFRAGVAHRLRLIANQRPD